MKKRFLAAAMAAVMALSVTACSGGSSAPETKAPESAEASKAEETSKAETEKETKAEEEKTEAAAEAEPITLNIAYMPNYGSLWSVAAAQAQGFMEEEGIKLNLVSFADGPTIIAAMESGSIDIGYIGQGAHKLCVNGQAKIFALSHISNGDAVIGGSSVKTMEDLKGKKVAYSSGTSSEDILNNTLTKAGMTMSDI